MSRFAVTLVALVFVTAALVVAAEHTIGQKGRLFTPGAVTVKSGDVLVFRNDDDVTHHIYSSTTGQEFNLDSMAPGAKANHAFSQKGRVDVRCGLHAGMRLVVTVE
jgi:plastocyanin